ncbi:MAG TPA: ammonium transporter [Phycisphaeraceae bacterium]
MKSWIRVGVVVPAVLLCMSASCWAQVSGAGEPPPIDAGTTAWMLTSVALVLLMVPGLAMFYGGLVRTKNVVGTMMHSYAAMAIIGVIWVVCGYAMSFGADVAGIVGWDWGKFLLRGVDGQVMPDYHVPELVFAMFQGKFAIITPALIAGAFAERVRFRGYCVFIALWSLLVYNPLAHIVWGGGYLTGEAIDFAGGTVVHISAGVSGLVAALYLGARRGYPRTAMHPNNLVMTLTGAGLLWVGWFGFNAGSAVSSGLQTAQALTATQAAAASGALMWMILEGLVHRKATSLGVASGIVAGLVAITPAAGSVTPAGAVILGAAASLICYPGLMLKARLGYDDSLDVFGIHGVAGIVGAVGLAFLLRDVPEHGVATQLWYQVKGVVVSVAVAATLTFALVVLVDWLLGLRLDDEAEMAGMDHSLHGEHGYGLLNPT